jgi:hypothetical protein
LTTGGLLQLVLRRWYLMLVGAVLSLAALYLVTHQPGIYWTQVNVVLLPPPEEYYPNRLEDPAYALAPMAGLIVADWNGNNRPMITASGDTPVFGEGLRQGAQVRLPNRGSQWQPNYASPIIDVQVVGHDADSVIQQTHQIGTELEELLQQRQDAVGVSRTMRMTTIMSSADPTVYHIWGSSVRAGAATGLAGAGLTTVAVYWIDRWLLLRRSSRSTRSQPSEAAAAAVKQAQWA